MTDFQGTAPDINVTITVPKYPETTSTEVLVRTERRINPSWLVSELKAKLEPITGIPASQQEIQHTNELTGKTVPLTPNSTVVGDSSFGIRKNSELRVLDLRPPGARGNFSDVSAVEKYEMPSDQYEKLGDSVLAWKKRQGLGRFDPNAKSVEEMTEERRDGDRKIVDERGIEVGKRCRVGGEDERRGVVRYVDEIEGLGGNKESGCTWVGVEFDEPVGRNDGSVKIDAGKGKIKMRNLFQCKMMYGVFARPEKVEIGEWPPLDDLNDDMEEL